jgi:hypothetical protein
VEFDAVLFADAAESVEALLKCARLSAVMRL